MSQRNQISLSANEPIGKKLLDSLQADLRTVSNESKRRSPQLKEAAEAGIVKLRSASSKHQDLRLALLSESQELLEPFLMACESKIPKMIQVSLGAIQRLISYEVVSSNAAISLVDCLWSLMEAELEELKLLQTVTLLISSNNVIHGDGLAKSLALCFRLHFTKNQTVNNAASATIRQLTSFVFERAQTEGENQELQSTPRVGVKYERLKTTSRNPPETLQPFAKDAFLLFQDFLQLVNGDQPFWLIGLVEMTRTFGLELLEIVLTNFPKIFYQHEEFLFLLKEKVCPLVIKLFSPNIKYKPHHQAQIQASQQFSNDSLSNNSNFSDKPIFPISIRLLRIVAVLVQNYYSLLITEGEIFLSLLIKFLENDKPIWQRALALEILHKMCQKPYLLSSFCQSYDMKQNSSKIFRDLIIAIGIFCQSMFLSPPITPSLLTSLINAASVASSSSTPPTSTVNANQINSNASISPQPAFSLRGIWVPLVFNLSLGQSKNYLVDQLDKLEPPSVPDGYGLTLAYLCLLAAVKSISSIIENPEITSKNLPSYCAESVIGKDCNLLEESSPSIPCGEKLRNIESLHPDVRLFHEFILNSSWTGLVAALSLLLDASTDEGTTESILKSMEKLASLYGLYGLGKPRDTIIIAMCRASLPAGYNLPLLNLDIPFNSENSSPTSLTPSESTTSIANSVSTCHSRSSSYDLSNHWAQSNLKLLSSSVGILQHAHNPPSSLNSIVQPRLSTQSDISDLRQQVVAVGTPLFSTQSSSSTSQLGPVMLTAKNLQCMKSVLTLSHSYGSTLESSWRVILTTLQHLAWILDLKPSTGGSLKVTKAGSDNSPVVGSNATGQSSTMPDLPVLSAMLSRLFESSQELSDDALMHLIDALCKLSWEAMENSYSNREPSLFAVAKLLETSLVNLNRRKILWVPVTDHLLKVCQHPQIKMREWGAEAMTCLVKNVLTLKDLEKNEKKLYLASLQSASSINHADIRQKQLDCVIQILQGSGESIGEGWPQILDIIGAINDSQSENLIRIAFQSLQLIIKDFLSSIPTLYLVLVVDTVAKFGSQTQEMNVALTAVSSLWDTADFLFQNRRTIEENLDDRNVPSGDDKKDPNSVLPAYDCLWMSLFAKLGDLCTDSRPSLRKSASQTLFATLTTHGEILDTRLWSAVLWQVLFPLLERVRLSTDSASDEKLVETSKLMGVNNMSTSSSSGSILLHHSRNTAHKQWSETQVLTLCGVIRIFCLKRDQFLSTIDHFERAWISLLSYIESSAQSKNIEVSLAALRGFKDVLCVSSPPSSHSLITPDQSSHDNNHFISQPFSKMSSSIPSSHKKLWSTAWKVWSNIGMHHMSYILNEPGNGEAHSTSNHRISKDDPNNSSGNLPSQAFLSSLIRIFPFIFSPIKDSFETDDFRKLFMIFEKCLSYPIDAATQTFMISTSSSISGPQDSNSHMIPLSPLQEAVIFVMETLQSDLLANLSLSESRCYVEKLLPTLINQFLIFSNYACYPPSQKSYNHSQNGKSIAMPDIAKLSLIPFGERCMKSALFLYQMTASSRHVIDGCIFHNIIKSLKTPLSLKYSCPSQSTWKLAHHCLIAGLTVGFPIARQYYSQKLDLWTDLGQVFESFLFTTSKPPNNQSLEDQQLDESLDVKIIELIRNNVLPFASQMPKEFVLQMVALLNRGSIHSSSTGSPTDTESSRRLREEFARHCFDTLLRFSFLSSKENPTIFLQASPKNSVPNDSSMEENGLVNRLVVTSLLQRFREVVIKYVEDEKLSGKCPLPRHRMAEITFVLQALATLASSMKKAPSEQVEQVVWNQMISLYPHLVDCTVSNNAQVNRALREVLQEYKDFLTPPQSRLIQRSSISNGT